jgi:hypothetical protein
VALGADLVARQRPVGLLSIFVSQRHWDPPQAADQRAQENDSM